MKLSFTLTFDDHAAAHRLYRKPAPGEGPGLAERLLFLWTLLGAVGLLFLAMIAEAVYRIASGVQSEIAGWAVSVVLPLIPFLLISGLIWFAIAGSVPSAERRALRRLMLIIMAMLLLLNVINTALTGPTPGRATRRAQIATATAPAADDGSFMTLLPWLVIFLAIWLFFFRFLRGAIQRNWDAQPHLRRPATMELTPHGLRFDNGVAVLDYRWECFLKWREGDTLFLLYPSDIGFLTVPKRAMPDAATVDAFRQLLWQHVRPVDAAPLGFPIPSAPPSPAMPPPLPTY